MSVTSSRASLTLDDSKSVQKHWFYDARPPKVFKKHWFYDARPPKVFKKHWFYDARPPNLWILLFRVPRNGVIGFTIRARKTNPGVHRFWGRGANTRLTSKKSYPLFSIGFTPRARQKKIILCFWLVLRFGLVKPIQWSTDSGGVAPILGRGPKKVILCFWLVFHLGLGKKSYHLFLIGFTIRARKTDPVVHRFWGRFANTR